MSIRSLSLNILRLYVDQNKNTIYNQLVILIFYLFLPDCAKSPVVQGGDE